MHPVTHPSNNVTYDKPQNDQGAKIAPLAVTEVEDGGIPYMVSFWKPFPEELEVLKNGGTVQLWIMGNRQPVVSMGVNESQTVDLNAHNQGFNSMRHAVKKNEPAPDRKRVYIVAPDVSAAQRIERAIVKDHADLLPGSPFIFQHVVGTNLLEKMRGIVPDMLFIGVREGVRLQDVDDPYFNARVELAREMLPLWDRNNGFRVHKIPL
jgi:hypothetical protein